MIAVWNWLKRWWKLLIGFAVGISGLFLTRKKPDPEKERIKKEHQEIKKVIAHEKAEIKIQQEEIDKRVKERDEKLKEIQKKFSSLFLIIIIIFGLSGIVYAADEQIYTLHEAALEKIAEQDKYIADLEQAIRDLTGIAKGYRGDWESQKQLTLNALDMVNYLEEFIELQQGVIEKQWRVIDQLTLRDKFEIGIEALLIENKIVPGISLKYRH